MCQSVANQRASHTHVRFSLETCTRVCNLFLQKLADAFPFGPQQGCK